MTNIITRVLAKVFKTIGNIFETQGYRSTSPQACRVTDQSDGDGNAIQGSPNVFVNNLPLVRLGDAFQEGILTSASHSVYANNIAVGRTGDTVTGLTICQVISGSPDVIIG